MLCAVKATGAAGQLFQRCAHSVDHGIEETGVIVECAEFIDVRLAIAGGYDVLAVLAASGIRIESGGEKCQRVPDAGVTHLAERVGQHRMPVAIAPVNGKMRTFGVEQLLEFGNQRAVLVVDRTAAAKVIIVFGDL